MAERRKKKSKVSKKVLLLVLLCLSIFFVLNIANEVTQMMTLKSSISESLRKQSKLNKKKEKLATDKKNLENPEYILRYVRGKYLVTKEDGEQVFKLPDE